MAVTPSSTVILSMPVPRSGDAAEVSASVARSLRTVSSLKLPQPSNEPFSSVFMVDGNENPCREAQPEKA